MFGKFWMGDLGLVAAMTLFFTGCGGSDGDSNSGGGNSIVGTWRMVSVTEEGVTFSAEDMGVTMVLTINANGTWAWSETWGDEVDAEQGTWSTSGNQLTITTTGESESETMTFGVNGNTLTINGSEGGVSTFTRI